MPASIQDIKKILSQYGLVKGNDSINEKVIERAAQIINREFEVNLKSETLLEQEIVDLSNSTTNTSSVEQGSSQSDSINNPKRASKPLSEQLEEVERERAKPLEKPSTKVQYQEGQKAAATDQQTHFQSVLKKIGQAQDATEPRRGTRSLTSQDEVSEAEAEEFFNEGGDEESIMSIDEDQLSQLFGNEDLNMPINPKDAMALQRALPKRLGQEGESKGSGRSISRLS